MTSPKPHRECVRAPPILGDTDAPRILPNAAHNNPERPPITMATATEIQAQINAEKQAHARRLAELEQKMLTAEHDELAELITTHAGTLPEDEIEALELAQIRHDVTRLKADIKVAKKVLEQVSTTGNPGQNRVISNPETGSEVTP
ncbi:hypothetical protein [Corynebacterium atrinae]|uniref:hypothetical protein n=1 Tax=Corynebacterium atrinae TaxID=1336740 RepID=UPI0025B62778|nr:hypothetical protein [Corynebacterium atrinae]